MVQRLSGSASEIGGRLAKAQTPGERRRGGKRVEEVFSLGLRLEQLGGKYL